jgi:hypothetical protein
MTALKRLNDSDAFPLLTGAGSATGDLVLVWDVSAAAYKAMTRAELSAGLYQSETISGIAYTISASDNGRTLRFTNGSAVTVTVPATLPVDFKCLAYQIGDGAVTFVEGSGATIDCGADSDGNDFRTIDGKWSSASLFVDSNGDGASAHCILEGVLRV